MSEVRTPEEVQTLLAEVVRVQSWGGMAAYNELLDHDAALRTRIAELEEEQREFLAYAGTESLADAYNKMSSLSYHATAATDALDGTKAQLASALQRAEAAEGLAKYLTDRVCAWIGVVEVTEADAEKHRTAAAALRAKAGLADEAADLIQHKNVTTVSGYTNEHHTQDAEDWLARYRAAGGQG